MPGRSGAGRVDVHSESTGRRRHTEEQQNMITEARLFWTKHPPMCPREHDALPEEAKRERRLDQRAAEAAYVHRTRGTPIPPDLIERARQFTVRPAEGATPQATTPKPAEEASGDFWRPVLARLFSPPGPHARPTASEARQDTPGAPGSPPPKPETASYEAPRRSQGASDAFWKPIMARIAAERRDSALRDPDRQVPAAGQPERDGQGTGGTIDWSTVIRKVADPARTVEHGPGRPRPGSDAARAAA
jgi:hypothetical protein